MATIAGQTLQLHCDCGALRGEASDIAPHTGVRLVCYCNDCQSYARALGRADLLNNRGGTAIFQTTPSRLAITSGIAHLRCLRLRPTGLMRWHAGCCNTPIANTFASARVPFAGVVVNVIAGTNTVQSVAAALGPVRGHINGRAAYGAAPPEVESTASARLLLAASWMLLRGFLRGRNNASPFFADDGVPTVAARVLSAAELQAASARS